MTTPKQLKSRFQYMFNGENIGISIPRGWMPIFEELCIDIDQALGSDKRGFHFTQCKEKFGAARWYWSMQGCQPSIKVNVIGQDGRVSLLSLGSQSGLHEDPVVQRIDQLVETASALTREACIVCGDSADLDRSQSWVLMLCVEHTHQRSIGQLRAIWFAQDVQ